MRRPLPLLFSTLLLLCVIPLHAAPKSLASVVLKSPGQGPKRALRYAYQPQLRYRYIVEMTNLGGRMNGKKLPPPALLAHRTIFEIRHQKRRPTGLEVRVSFSDMTDLKGRSLGETNPEFKKKLPEMRKIRRLVMLSNRGIVTPLKSMTPSQLTPRLLLRWLMPQLFQYQTIPLPVEPVGVGARWQVKQGLNLKGLEIEQRSTVTLNKLSGQRIQLSARFSYHASKRPSRMPTNMKLLSVTGGGTMRIVVDLAQPRHRIEMTTYARTVLGIGKKSSKLVSENRSKIVIKPAN